MLNPKSTNFYIQGFFLAIFQNYLHLLEGKWLPSNLLRSGIERWDVKKHSSWMYVLSYIDVWIIGVLELSYNSHLLFASIKNISFKSAFFFLACKLLQLQMIFNISSLLINMSEWHEYPHLQKKMLRQDNNAITYQKLRSKWTCPTQRSVQECF